jgi:hypothetical protein
MIQPVTYPAWQDPARRTVSGDAFAPPGERERKNSQGSIEAKEEERWDERQPLSPSLSHGTEEDIHHAHQHSHVLSHPPAHLQSEQDGQISQFKDGIVYTDDAETKQTAEVSRARRRHLCADGGSSSGNATTAKRPTLRAGGNQSLGPAKS